MHLKTRGSIVTAAAIATLMLTDSVPVTAADDMQDALDYCESVGGQVVQRHAMWNTNAPDTAQWVDLDRTMEVCSFRAEDDSRIAVDLQTLYSEEPSLAAAAYLSKIPLPDELPQGNPATSHCADLGGSSQFGTGAQGGGWVSMDDPIDVIMAMCVLPDGSAIEQWGIAYYSVGTIRGADLAPLLRSNPESYPPIFGR